ncbi:beta-lactamase family protein [Kitasatospora sp. NA04385]|uniref:serine hydrolase domain-containing protein n=1 Tax=Kitasatospora sp. NA04385 TaxID=2742135 RepID=UPI001590E222|nr:serine hydrolase domain-containing protein [Kitasatospora sp. NA04385]QKW20422.1 beta-lactamase family protein [Kitasatospora sp. NA04385]
MRARTTVGRLAGTAAIGALVVSLTAGTSGAAQITVHRARPDAAALRASIAGLPSAEITSAVVLVDGDGGRWSGTSGTGDPATGRPVNADGRFRIGSISKVFTATVLLQLAAEHRIDLDGTVQRYLPHALPEGYPPITVRQLLNHTSGLPSGGKLFAPDGSTDDGSAAWFAAHAADHWTPRQAVDVLAGQPMQFAPGTAQQYNGVNYYLAGLLIERVTGRSFEREVTDRILRPLGLRHTSAPAATDTALPDPTAHAVLAVPRPDGGTGLADVTRQSPWPWAEGGMLSSAPDLERFLSALLRGELLPPAQQAELFAVPDVPNFHNQNCDIGPTTGRACFSTGLMRFTPAPGIELWGKTGSRPGWTSAMFATRDASRDLVCSFTPTSRQGASFPAQYRVAAAAFDLPAL